MPETAPTSAWLPRCLFWLALAGSALLAMLLFLTPLLHREGTPTDERSRVLALFAQDAVVRRTAFASAVGLTVTAFVFFRPAGRSATRKSSKPPPPAMMGA